MTRAIVPYFLLTLLGVSAPACDFVTPPTFGSPCEAECQAGYRCEDGLCLPERDATVNGLGKIEITSGDGQRGTRGATLEPLVVSVVDVARSPVVGFVVEFTAPPSLFLSASAVATDGNGVAQTVATLGLVAGESTIEAGAAGFEGSPVRFTLTTIPESCTTPAQCPSSTACRSWSCVDSRCQDSGVRDGEECAAETDCQSFTCQVGQCVASPIRDGDSCTLMDYVPSVCMQPRCRIGTCGVEIVEENLGALCNIETCQEGYCSETGECVVVPTP
jgi:hypothetical protein